MKRKITTMDGGKEDIFFRQKCAVYDFFNTVFGF